MGIQVVWDDAEQTIIRWDFDPEWDWNDFWGAFDTSLKMAEGFSYRMDVIPNVTHSKRLPIGALGAFKTIDTRMPEYTKLVIVAGPDNITGVMIQTFARINRIDSWRIAKNVDEARAIIHRDRQANS